MKITSITATPVSFRVKHAPYTGEGAGSKFHWGGRRERITSKRPDPVLEYVIVRIDTDVGVSGWGESQADIGFFGNTVEDLVAAISDYLGPHLIGKDPFDREHLMSLIDFRGLSCAKAGIDMALLDLAGRALGTSVATLIGGRHEQRVGVSIEIAGGTAESMANECLRFMALGVNEFKAKIGGDPEADADRLRAIRQAVGDEVTLRADANQGYDPKEAIRFCRLVERSDIHLSLLEQPVLAHDLDGMALVRRSVDTPICADESVYTLQDALRVIKLGAADVINVKVGKAGGLTQAKKIVALAEAAGLRCVIGTAFGTGLEIAAKLQLAAATPWIRDGVEFTELGLHETLLVTTDAAELSLPLSDHSLPVPNGPGLGVTLEPSKLRQYAMASNQVR